MCKNVHRYLWVITGLWSFSKGALGIWVSLKVGFRSGFKGFGFRLWFLLGIKQDYLSNFYVGYSETPARRFRASITQL